MLQYNLDFRGLSTRGASGSPFREEDGGVAGAGAMAARWAGPPAPTPPYDSSGWPGGPRETPAAPGSRSCCSETLGTACGNARRNLSHRQD
ncbi:hypothetical protein PR048_020526 [Dryococelus australis]|uniref:Uncharacterized protein n=1 Tax=Dryococelus australis TaxID=614101 RepID=A0ABQ9H6Q3_9NEOP|nr:hypothetical protein PR048_020526 [Dryococelus australis]